MTVISCRNDTQLSSSIFNHETERGAKNKKVSRSQFNAAFHNCLLFILTVCTSVNTRSKVRLMMESWEGAKESSKGGGHRNVFIVTQILDNLRI